MLSAAIVMAILTSANASGAEPDRTAMTCRALPPLIRPIAGQFVAAVGTRLVVAGGTYWSPPQGEGKTRRKIWVQTIQILNQSAEQWRVVGWLPEPIAYGAAVPAPDGMILIGGQTPDGASASVLKLGWNGDRVMINHLPDLPHSLFNMTAAIVGNLVYVAGGQVGADSGAEKIFLQLDLSATGTNLRWTRLPTWPGPGRILAASVACDDCFYLFGGAELTRNDSGVLQRRYLNDAFRYCREEGWRQVRNLPRPAVAAPSVCGKDGNPLLLGGDDGSLAGKQLQAAHPGFSRIIWRYVRHADEWRQAGELPEGLVTTGAAHWQGEIIIAGGEDRPGSRSASVIGLKRR